jgi:molecular chaperone DnaK (HSP70)
MTMVLKYVKLEAEKFVKGSIKDAVLILPNYWTIHQRNFVLQAASVADIYVLSIISENTAASINYALSQRTQNKTENVLFYNVGSNSLQMTLVEYKQIQVESSPKPVESIFIKDDFGKPYVGGLRLDSIICKYFEEVF